MGEGGRYRSPSVSSRDRGHRGAKLKLNCNTLNLRWWYYFTPVPFREGGTPSCSFAAVLTRDVSVTSSLAGHMYDTYVKRVVHMRGKLYFKYAKRQLTEFEMQSLEDRCVRLLAVPPAKLCFGCHFAIDRWVGAVKVVRRSSYRSTPEYCS